MYFQKFPLIYHAYTDSNGQEILVRLKDITRNIRVRRDVLANITLYEYYTLRDDETPEDVAEKVYGSATYHWVVLLLNEKYDYTSDFPLNSVDLNTHIVNTYGEGNEYATHHYINAAGFKVNPEQAGATSVSNFQYEDEMNEAKRRIKLIDPSLLATLLANFETIMAV